MFLFYNLKRKKMKKGLLLVVVMLATIAVKLNDHFSFIAKYGFLGYRKNVNTSGDSFGLMLTSEDLSIGFHYNF